MAKPIHREETEALRRVLRQARAEAGLTQVQLAAALGKPQAYVSAIETGLRRVDVVEMLDICKVLGISLADFAVRLESAIENSLAVPNSEAVQGKPHKKTRRRENPSPR